MKPFVLAWAALLTISSAAQSSGVKARLALVSSVAEDGQYSVFDCEKTAISTLPEPVVVNGDQADFKPGEKLYLQPGAEMVDKGGIERSIDTYNGVPDFLPVRADHSHNYTMLRNRYPGSNTGHPFTTSAQDKRELVISALPLPESLTPVKAIFAELGGSGGFLSINYDTRLSKSGKGMGIRIGAGTITDLNSFALTVPFGFNYLAGERTHFFESALGATFFSFSEQNQDSWFSFRHLKFLAPYLWLGYRYQPDDKRFFFRGGVNQFFAGGMSGFIAGPFPGFSFGYSIR